MKNWAFKVIMLLAMCISYTDIYSQVVLVSEKFSIINSETDEQSPIVYVTTVITIDKDSVITIRMGGKKDRIKHVFTVGEKIEGSCNDTYLCVNVDTKKRFVITIIIKDNGASVALADFVSPSYYLFYLNY